MTEPTQDGCDANIPPRRAKTGEDFGRFGRHLQGAGRSFGTHATTPLAVIKWAEVQALLEPLGLEPKAFNMLSNTIRQTMGVYIGALQLADMKRGHSQSRADLKVIANQASRLAAKIQDLDPEILTRLDRQGMARDPNGRTFEFLHLVPRLERLSEAAKETHKMVEARPAGSPGGELLDTAIKALLPAIEAAGLEVNPVVANASLVPKTLRGDGGELLERTLMHFNRFLSSGDIFGAVERVREAESDASDAVQAN